jgi:hypothetical protein
MPTPDRLSELLAAALAAARRGWPVLPLRPGSKLPAVRNWERRATTDPDRIAAWWHRTPHNVGIACGPAGLVVLDLDVAHGHRPPPDWSNRGAVHGRDILRLLADDAGQPDPTDTYTVATPTGGEHRYFLAPAGPALRNTTGDTGRGLGWHLDTRATGGSITAAGSIRLIDGEPRRYRIIRDLPPAPLPTWIHTLLTGTPAPPAPPGPPGPAESPGSLGASGRAHRPLPPAGPRLDAYVRAALDGEADAVARAEPGTRATTLFRAAVHLGELVGSGAVDEATVVETLRRGAAYHNGVDEWTDREARHHIGNGLAAGRRHPRAS